MKNDRKILKEPPPKKRKKKKNWKFENFEKSDLSEMARTLIKNSNFFASYDDIIDDDNVDDVDDDDDGGI